MDVGPTDADMLDAVVRLIWLLDAPIERKVLAPLIVREIIFRLLVGGQGARLGHAGADTHRISKAIGVCAKTLTSRSEWMTSRTNSA